MSPHAPSFVRIQASALPHRLWTPPVRHSRSHLHPRRRDWVMIPLPYASTQSVPWPKLWHAMTRTPPVTDTSSGEENNGRSTPHEPSTISRAVESPSSTQRQRHFVVRPARTSSRDLDLLRAANDLEAQGVGLPLLLRFSDILRSRIESLTERFKRATREYEYTGGYTTVYPIKVNQQRHVVEEIVEFGKGSGVGLECGSKPELQAVLALAEHTDHLIVCNGYKMRSSCARPQDRSSDTSLHRTRAAQENRVFSSGGELGVIHRRRPHPVTRRVGRWQSGGEKSKFGLALLLGAGRPPEGGQRLESQRILFHLGSQSPTSATSRRGCRRSRATTPSCARWAWTSRT